MRVFFTRIVAGKEVVRRSGIELEGGSIRNEIFVISISYVFVFVGAWNDGLVGLGPSVYARAAEIGLASALFAEIVLRIVFVKRKTVLFWLVLALDSISVLTVLPMLIGASFVRSGRVIYSGVRLIALLDHLAYTKKNALFLVTLYPIVVPLVAAVVFALERNTAGSPIRTYFDALAVCFQFALSFGTVRPSNPWAMSLCGGLFIVGLMCIGVATNVLTSRYHRDSA